MGKIFRNNQPITPLIANKDIETTKGLLDGSLTTMNNLLGATSLKPYRFNDFDNLTDLNLTGVNIIPNYTAADCSNLVNLTLDSNTTEIGDYAFNDCRKLNINELPNTITTIGDYGCNYLAYSNTSGFEFNPLNECSLDQYALRYSKITKLTGVFNKLGQYALSYCNNLNDVDIVVNGDISSYVFDSSINVLNSNISGLLTSIGTSAFRYYGRDRANPEQHIFNFNFKNSTFEQIGSYCFAGDSTTKNSYYNIYLPNTLISIQSYAFQYTDHFNVFFTGDIPTVQSNTFNHTTNNTYYAPYNKVNSYREATNWITVADSIQGWADGGMFTQGQTLPTINIEGYALTWYSDMARTIPITIVTDPTVPLYCTVGIERIAVLFKSFSQYQAICTVSDGVRNYVKDDVIPVGTVLTITATAEAGYSAYIFTLNGTTIASGDTYTVGQDDINIVCVYWDGVTPPVNPVFADNTPAMIKVGVDTGLARTMWAIGDTKPITLTNGWTGLIRYTDQQTNRYAKTDGTGYSNAVLEFTSIIQRAQMNTTSTNIGGWAECDMRESTMEEIYQLLPADWQAIISDVQIPSSAGGQSTEITYSSNKLFLASTIEITGTPTYSAPGEGTIYDWYVGKSTSERIKQLSGSNAYWWLRSPNVSNSSTFVIVYPSGGIYSNDANNSYGASPCFAI